MANNTLRTSGTLDECLETLTSKEACTIRDFTKDGACSRCGGCCSVFLALSDAEIRNIRTYMEKHHITAPKKHGPAVPGQTSIDMLCPFLSTENGATACTIYEARPHICRLYSCHMTEDMAVRCGEMLLGKGSLNKDQMPETRHAGETFFPGHYTKESVYVAAAVLKKQLKQQKETE